MEQLTGFCVPQPHCVVVTATENLFAIWTKGDRNYKTCRTLEGIEQLTGFCVRQPQGVVITPNEKLFAIWAKGDRTDTTCMTF